MSTDTAGLEPMTDTKTEAAGLVKTLPWKSRSDRVSEAETTFGDYQVAYYEEHGEGSGWAAIFRDGYEIGNYPTDSIAMSAAQADYERRILSTLDLTALEAAQAEVERLTKERDDARSDRDSHQREAIRNLEDRDSYKASMHAFFKRAVAAEASFTAAQERIAVLEGALKQTCAAIGDWARPTGANGMTSVHPDHPMIVAAHAGWAALSPKNTVGGDA